MSMMLMVQALKAKVGSPLRKLVLVKLADQANDNGECWPSYQTVADACEMGRSTVRAHIAWLEEHGFLRIEYRHYGNGGKSKTNVYHLTIEKGSEAERNSQGRDSNGSNPDRLDSDRLDSDRGVLKSDPFNGSNPDPEPINKPINEPLPTSWVSARATTDDEQPKFPDPPPEPPSPAKPKRQSREEAFVAFVVERGVDEETARCWWQYRDGKPMTSKAWQRHCAQADAAGISPQAAADYTAGREWRAFYADGYLREMADTELARRQSAPQGRVFDQVPQGGIVPVGMPATFGGLPAGRTSKMSQGLAALEELKAKIDRGEI